MFSGLSPPLIFDLKRLIKDFYPDLSDIKEKKTNVPLQSQQGPVEGE